jgi:uncharacterized membrane-anchored protein
MRFAVYSLGRAWVFLCLLVVVLVAAPGGAQPKKDVLKPGDIQWKYGPLKAELGDVATIDVPKGMQFAGGDGARRYLEVTGNPPGGDEVGILMPAFKDGKDDVPWFILFEFDEVGHVDETDKDKLDPDALLKHMQASTEEDNKIRKEKGWILFHLTGWQQKPFFDDKTKNLTWATLGKADSGKPDDLTVNYQVRMLGRRGTMNVDLILDPGELGETVPQFNSLIGGFAFNPGSRYSEFTKGDKIAGYGLAALIAGGAGAVAVKTGFFAKILAMFAALWKVLAVAAAAIASKFRELWEWVKGLFRRKPRRDGDDGER